MRNKLATLAGLALLFGCAKKEEPVSHQSILDEYKAHNVRLDTLATPLLSANHDLCQNTTNDTGIRWHSLEDYPEELRPVVQSYWGVTTDPSVFFVLENSVAARAGYSAGDRPNKDLTDKLTGKSICKYGIYVSYVDEVNAFATGEDIIVTSGMLRAIEDDKYLTLVLAHEISHNILEHPSNPDIEAPETEADLTAVKLLARAGIDYHEAIKRREAHQMKMAGRDGITEFESERIERFKSYAKQVQSMQDSGEAILP